MMLTQFNQAVYQGGRQGKCQNASVSQGKLLVLICHSALLGGTQMLDALFALVFPADKWTVSIKKN